VNVAFFGYTQDYNGYSILEDDWWQGGYEAGGSIWGPRQGEFLVDRAEYFFELTHANGPKISRGPEEAPEIWVFENVEERVDPYIPTPPVDLGTVVLDATMVYGVEDIVEVTVLGSDPWLGTPVATLMNDSGDPVTYANGVPVDSDGYAFWVNLAVDPLYSEEMRPASRSFFWTFYMPAQLIVPGLVPDLVGGTYFLRFSIPTDTDPVEVDSASFDIQ
jgi:hypothetical protein